MNPIYQLQYSNNTLEGRKVRQCMIQTPKTCRKKSRRIYETGLTQLSWHSVLRTPMASMPFTPIASTPLLASSLSALGWGSAAQADMQTSLFIHFTPTNSSSATTLAPLRSTTLHLCWTALHPALFSETLTRCKLKHEMVALLAWVAAAT